MSRPLVSIIILSYKNYHYFYEALNSLLMQDYPNIEVIISNDGSDDFNEKEVREYLTKHKNKNIKNVIIKNNKNNLGTVKSLNNAIKMADGEFIIAFAADDVFYDKNVINNFIKEFEKLPKSEYVITSQVRMYDIHLKKLIQLFVSKSKIKLINYSKPLELFNQMSTKCIIPAAGTCYKKSLFEKYGYFDERYLLVEDYSSALRFSRLGIRFNYCDFISFKHRDGGISHGNINGENKLNKQYDLDILNIMKNEILPHLNLLDKKSKKEFIRLYNDANLWFKYRYYFINSNEKEKREFIAKNFKEIFFSSYRTFKKYLAIQLSGKKFKILLVGIFLFFFFASSQILKLAGLLIIFFSLALTFYQIMRLYLPKIINFIKFIN